MAEVYNPEQQEPSDFVKEEVPTTHVSDEIWKLILDRSKIPEVMIHLLKGEVWVTEEKDGEIVGRYEPRGKPLMNEIGIKFFTPFLYFSVTPDKLATFITEEELNRMMLSMTQTLIEVITERGDEFDIPASNRGYVLQLLEQSYFMSLTSSRKGTILQALKPMYERKEIYSPMPKQKFNMPTFLGGT